ncbi:endonuclease [Aquimarina brevivitae]|uniref:Putative secreted protein (Por secretion system target) n=1 Tax=Aquimarina brevivitae TaxID=323412 RepID=A0A4Q7P2D1_9FLAO|nr:endonuclease [Aquimarina brevivitae]RZS93540.1 putative secreted protein (Por secretion system target) [Aquimarina brevivitae]
MKRLVIVPLLLFFIMAYAQVPPYYNDVNLSLTGQALFNELGDKVSTSHTTFLTYTPGVWEALKQSDINPANQSKVLLLYGFSDNDGNSTTDRSRAIDNNGGGVTQWNREHTYPKSLGQPNLGTEGAGADAHHLRPCDVQRNSDRSNRKFAAGNGNSGITPQGHWYPGDEWKGDVARMMMYMYIRYGSQCLPSNVGVGNSLSTDANMIDLFLQWNVEDPVSDFELQRNPVLESLQGNRNPFIDNPAFATQIWGGPQAEDRFGTSDPDTEAPSIPVGLVATDITTNTVTLSWSPAQDNVGVTQYSVFQNSTLVTTVGSNSATISGLSAATNYTFAVNARDTAGNTSPLSTALAVTTNSASGSGTISELIISEYVEGSSYNKALEIANFTGQSVDLSQYVIRKQTNGSGSWGGDLYLSGMLAHGAAYVIANSNASSALQSRANLLDNSGSLNFNGNDPIGLFKGNTLIDIVGNYNGGTAIFGKDQTLRRKSNIQEPSSSYQSGQWEVFPQNTLVGLGDHQFDGVGSDTVPPTAPANVVASQVTQNSCVLSWDPSNDNVGVFAYEIYANNTYLGATTNRSFTISDLNPATTYNFILLAYDAANNVSSASGVSVTTLATSLTYCASQGNNTNYEYIDYVSISGIDNVTGPSTGYANYTSQVANLNYGTNTIVISAGFTSSAYTEFWSVWIDFNQNGTFEAAERVVNGSSSSAEQLYANFTVPTTAVAGNTRMRVSMKWNSEPSPCETFGYGEVEDYTVSIGNGRSNSVPSNALKLPLENEKPIFDLVLHPNPVTSTLSIVCKDRRAMDFKLTDSSGKVVKSFTSRDQSEIHLNLSNLASGLYILSAFDGNRKIFKKLIIE